MKIEPLVVGGMVIGTQVRDGAGHIISQNLYIESEWYAVEQEKSVIRPSHYRKGDLECMDVIIAMTADHSGEEGFMIGNVIKYLWRWKEKNGVEDLKKAREYLDRVIGELGE